jgi:predicted porin
LEKLEMKKTLVALAALAVTSAFAQSSVTLSGVADVGLTYNSGNGDKQGSEKILLGSGNNNRIIFSGVEDLGGGLAATFAFQLRLDPTTGNNERGTAVIGLNGPAVAPNASGVGVPAATPTSRPLFQGESTVGLRGGFGSIKMGRWLTAVQLLNGGMLDPWGVTTVGGSVYATGFASDYAQGGEGRIGNGLFYTSPNFGGFSVLYSQGFLKGPTGGRNSSIAGTFNNGPINVMLGYERNRAKDTLVQLGGNYDLGVAKLYAGYGNIKGGKTADRAGMSYLATASGAQVAPGGNIKDYTIGVNVPLGAATARAGYSRWNFNGATGAKNESKIGLGVNYALSKRTAIYSDLANTTRKNAGLSNVTGFDLGIAHSF